MIKIYKIRAVHTQKSAVGLDQAAQIVKASCTLEYFSIAQMDIKCAVDDLAILQASKVYTCDTAFAPKDDTVGLLLFASGKNGIHQAKE